MIAPSYDVDRKKITIHKIKQFTLDFARAFSYTYEVELPSLGGYGGAMS
jgi:hypothetical protein